jgi:hypothetical protein
MFENFSDKKIQEYVLFSAVLATTDLYLQYVNIKTDEARKHARSSFRKRLEFKPQPGVHSSTLLYEHPAIHNTMVKYLLIIHFIYPEQEKFFMNFQQKKARDINI